MASMTNIFKLLIPIIILTTPSCAIYTKYADSCPTAPGTRFQEYNTCFLYFDNVYMGIDLNNRIIEYEFLFITPLIPIPVQLRDKLTRDELDYFYLEFEITPIADGYYFDPHAVILKADDQIYSPIIVENETDETSSESDFILTNEIIHLEYTKDDKPYKFLIKYHGKPPMPKRDISIDLKKALINEQFPSLPVIHLKKRSWTNCRS